MYTRSRSRYRRRPRRKRFLIPAFLFLLGAAILIFILLKTGILPTDLPAWAGAANPSTGTSSSSPASDNSDPGTKPEAALPTLEEAPWYLTLVNQDHPLPESWAIETKTLSSGLEVDARIYDALTNMLNDCKAEGLSPVVCSAYRTISRQHELFDQKLDAYMSDGLTYGEAYEAASTVVAVPGTSEHNLGLAIDICSTDYQILDDAQADTPEQRWLMEHCAEYGFILRYPKGKEAITGIIWEPWHYRYVGVELAKEITESGLCLEEYLQTVYSGV